MPTFNSVVDGTKYEVDAPDQATADRWAKYTHDNGGPVQPELTATQDGATDIAGLGGAVIRGAAPVATGALAGGALAGPPGAALGAGTVGVAQLVGDPIVTAINQALGTNIIMPSQDLQNLMTQVGIPSADSPVERVVQAGAGAAGGAAGIAGLGRSIAGAAAPGSTLAASGEVLGANVPMQVSGGAGAGVGGQTAAEQGVGLPGQLAASLAGGLGAGLAAGTTVAARPPSQLASAKEAERQGIRVLTSDVSPPDTFFGRWLQSTPEKIPYAGTGGIRAEQQADRVKAAERVMLEHGAGEFMPTVSKVMDDLIKKRGDDLSKFSRMKNEVIDRIAENRQAVPVSRTTDVIDNEISAMQGLRTESNKSAIALLADFKEAIRKQDLHNIERLRVRLGDAYKDPSLAGVRSDLEKAVGRVYGALKEDMGNFIKANGEPRDYAKWAVANRNLADMSSELKKGALKSVLKTGEETPEAVSKLLLSEKPSDVMALYRGLNEQGRSNARAAIISEAARRATLKDGFNPDVFAREVKKLRTQVGVFFDPSQRKSLDGLTRALELTKRAPIASASPPTGVQTVIPVGLDLLIGQSGGVAGATASAVSLGLLARAYESKAVRDILVKIPATAKGTDEESALAKRLVATLQAEMSQQSAEKK